MGGSEIRIGILGCALIAKKLSRAITLSPNAVVAAVGSRSLEKASRFVTENGLPPSSVKIYSSYEAVLEDADIDAVYLPLPTSLHPQWAVSAALHKKHVLLEKPVALNVAQLDLILDACSSNGVQFMDSTMWMHHPRTHDMRLLLSHPARFGHIKIIQSSFTYRGDEDFFKNNIRVKSDMDSLGALGDLGWYCIRAMLWAADYELPETVRAVEGTVFNEVGVILSCGATLCWKGEDKVGSFHCSFLANMTMDLSITGTRGCIRLHDFVIPVDEKQAAFTFTPDSPCSDILESGIPTPSEHVAVLDLPQEALMVKEFAELVKGVKERGLKSDSKWPAISRKTQLVLDAVYKSVHSGSAPVAVGL